MTRAIALVFCAFVLLPFAAAQDKKYSIKTTTNPIPKDVAEPIAKLLGDKSVQLLDPAGTPLCEIWLRKEIPAEATPVQLKTGVTYREVKQTEIFGAIQVHKDVTDYRKQKIKVGVYTLRLAFQPTDGKHTADVSEYQEFLLVIKANADTKPALMEAKMLADRSGDSLDLAHPGVFMLCPNTKPGADPKLEPRPKAHWVLNTKAGLAVGGKSTGTDLGIGITLIGHSPAE
jgi:hypothetical protein